MDNDQRFIRTRLLLGDAAFSRLQAGHVAIIGLGAVGGYAMEGLVRAGVGEITLVDFDTIQPSNLNRQILALDSTIGTTKVRAGECRSKDINPACRVHALELFADDQSIATILDLHPDIVIDAIDSLNPKVQILSACHHHSMKVFSSMGAALRRDPWQIRCDDIAKTRGCPLARRLRKRLRALGVFSGITCVYSTEPVEFTYPPTDPADPAGLPTLDRGRQRNTLGSLPTLTALFGLTLANEAIRWLAEERP